MAVSITGTQPLPLSLSYLQVSAGRGSVHRARHLRHIRVVVEPAHHLHPAVRGRAPHTQVRVREGITLDVLGHHEADVPLRRGDVAVPEIRPLLPGLVLADPLPYAEVREDGLRRPLMLPLLLLLLLLRQRCGICCCASR